MTTNELGRIIASFAPLTLQESWDNCGYNVNLHNDVSAVMLCLDVTSEVIKEAVECGCEVIISHHPLLFHKIRQIDSERFPGGLLAALLRHNISLYCAHTTMDCALPGINRYVANMLGLRDVVPLIPADTALCKLAVTVPRENADELRDALFRAGAGNIGDYSDCSFAFDGTGTFRPLAGSAPYIGEQDLLSEVDEVMLQVVVPASRRPAAEQAIRDVHPYETPAADFYPVETMLAEDAGLGCVGTLEHPTSLRDFAGFVRKTLACPSVEVSGALDGTITRVALCTGAGGSVIDDAVSRADVFVTGEVKHNDFMEAKMPIIAAGHYDTEKWFTDAMRSALQKSGVGVEYKVDICVSQSMRRPYRVIF